MVETIPFTNNLNKQMNGCLASSSNHIQRFNYQHDVRFGRFRGGLSATAPKRNRCSIGLYSYIAKVIIVVLLLTVCILNMKIAFDQQSQYEKRAFVYYQSLDDNGLLGVDTRKSPEPAAEQASDGVSFRVSVLSSKDAVRVEVDGTVLYEDRRTKAGRGIHVVMINQLTGASMGVRCFDTYSEGYDADLLQFVNDVADRDRLLAFAVKDEASYNLREKTRYELGKKIGSDVVDRLQWRNMWALITTARGVKIFEELHVSENKTDWAAPVLFNVTVTASSLKDDHTCQWPATDENTRRAAFCAKYDGYGDLCGCYKPFPYNVSQVNFPRNVVGDIPVAVIASNRPQHLYRCLQSIFAAHGVNPASITVFIDGRFTETMDVARLFGARAFYHTPVGTGSARISQNYRSSLKALFELYPHAQHAIIVEEDLEVAGDFFRYFNHLLPTMNKDPTVYCISAWNDHGYEHSSVDTSLFYRVETMPGLGWMLKRSLFENELLPNWPGSDLQWDWDMWMRRDDVRRGRECIVPDVPRTYHFGMNGVNMNSYFFRLYFANHKLNRNASAVYRPATEMNEANYERIMHRLVREATTVDHNKSPCDEDFLPDHPGVFVAYFRHSKRRESDVFKKILKCLGIWDLDDRGLHRSAFRTFIRGQHVVFVGYPLSPYSIYKPVHVQPLDLL